MVVSALLAASSGLAGTADDPEITDPSGDASVSTDLSGDFSGMVDITQAWVVKDGADLAFHLQVAGSDVSFEDAGTTVDATWHVAFVADSSWRIVLDWTGTPASPEVRILEDGSEVDESVSESRSSDTITFTWTGAVDTLGSQAVLTDLHAYTQASDSNDADCHGEQVVDCGPDDPEFGRDFAVAGAAADLSLSATPSEERIAKGSTGIFDVVVSNAGNETLNVTLSADAPEGWNTSFVPENLSLAGGTASSSSFNVQVPGSADNGTTNLSIHANVGEDRISTEVAVNVTEEGTGGGQGNPYEFSAPTTAKTTTAGQPVGYDVVISNVGDSSDRYSIHVDEGQKSWVSFSTKQVEIDAGDSATISVQIEPPAATGVGSYDHLIGVHPLSNPSNTKTVSLTTTVEAGGGGGDGGGFGLEDLFGTGQQRTIVLSAIGAVVLLVVIIALVVLKRRSDRRLYGEEQAAQDEDHIYRP